MLIALSGYARSGKDSLAGFLIEDHGFKRYAFADTLRSVVYALNPLVNNEIDATIGKFVTERRLQEIVDDIGWDRAKVEHAEIRRLLQSMGTEAGRKILGDNIWVDATFDKMNDPFEKVVITDCRFVNEAQRVKAEGGLMVRVNRPGTKPINKHVSEVALDDWPHDFTIRNEASLDVLREAAKDLVSECAILFNLVLA